MSEERIRGIIREKLQTGDLPRRQSDRIWGGRGSGRACAVCNEAIATSSSEIEDRDDDGTVLVFHARCHSLLSQERDGASW
jgi:hypothetical protein